MAAKFNSSEWTKIRNELNNDPVAYGLPQRKYGSVLIGSFNIRKLGKLGTSSGRDDSTMRFLADVCRKFDLVAVQEVMPELTGVRRLRDLMGEEYGLIVSDIVGTFPGESGNEERLAFIYNRAIVRRAELVTEISTSRTRVLKTIAQHHKDLFDAMDKNKSAEALRNFYNNEYAKYLADLEARKNPNEPRPPKFSVNIDPFLQFIRTPFAVGFQVHGHPGLESYDFLAVNAHLQFGRPQDRKAEAEAVFEWIVGKVLSPESPTILLLGDLNFDLDNPEKDLERIVTKFNRIRGKNEDKCFVSFPFIFPHPKPPALHPPKTVYRTNVLLSQTYDQIGVFSPDQRVGKFLETTAQGHGPKTRWGQDGKPDYGVFDFTDLFSVALNGGKTFNQLSSAKRKAFVDRYQHKVSDHMPIWMRIPLPAANKGFPTSG